MKTVLAILLLATAAFAQHDLSHHDADVNKHGAEAMGFDQDRTTHHFALTRDGGYVQVTANNAKDDASVKQIRSHLQEQQKKFAQGDFSAPEQTHSRVPPGVSTMRRLRSVIRYKYEPIDGGGRLRIISHNYEALAAIHDFLKFQISDHHTGDPATVQQAPLTK